MLRQFTFHKFSSHFESSVYLIIYLYLFIYLSIYLFIYLFIYFMIYWQILVRDAQFSNAGLNRALSYLLNN